MNPTQPQYVTIQEPRAVTRIVYGNAIRAAVTDTERAELLGALNWYETKWRAQDAQAQQAARAPQQERPQGQAQGEPRQLSAVEEHGPDSPQAEAAREARRAARAERQGQG